MADHYHLGTNSLSTPNTKTIRRRSPVSNCKFTKLLCSSFKIWIHLKLDSLSTRTHSLVYYIKKKSKITDSISFLVIRSLRISHRKRWPRRCRLWCWRRRSRILSRNMGQFGQIRNESKILENGLLFAVSNVLGILRMIIDNRAHSAYAHTHTLTLCLQMHLQRVHLRNGMWFLVFWRWSGMSLCVRCAKWSNFKDLEHASTSNLSQADIFKKTL